MKANISGAEMSLLLVIKIMCIYLFVEPNYTITFMCLLTAGFLLYLPFVFVDHVSVFNYGLFVIKYRLVFSSRSIF
jgi:hypothetical protein